MSDPTLTDRIHSKFLNLYQRPKSSRNNPPRIPTNFQTDVRRGTHTSIKQQEVPRELIMLTNQQKSAAKRLAYYHLETNEKGTKQKKKNFVPFFNDYDNFFGPSVTQEMSWN